MALEQTLNETLTKAIKEKDPKTADVIRMIKSKIGERGAAHAAQLRFELEFCDRYLPKGMDEAALRTLIRERLDALKIADAKQVGRLVGDIMKTHKGQVDAADVKRVAEGMLKT